MVKFIYTIKINALYEIKILLRSWFFRIFAAASTLVILGLDILFFSTVSPVPRFMRGLDSFLPYMNTLLPYFIFLVLIVFLTTDLYKRDRKYNTSDVIYIRDMSNFSFFIGRISGLLLLFMLLECLHLFIAFIINLFFSDLNVIWQAYLIYPLLLSFPAFVFTVGLTFFLMFIIRNQAVVIILVLGLLAGSVFSFYAYGYLILDIAVARLPFAYSDFIGLGNFDLIFFHRLTWFCSGLFLLFLSILFSKRLPQSKKATQFIIISCIVFPVIIVFSFLKYISYYENGKTIRYETQKELGQFSKSRTAKIIRYNLDVEHQENEILVHADLLFKNTFDVPVDTLSFLLNRGLGISEISQQSQDLPFIQKGTLVQVPLKQKLFNSNVDSIRVTYRGSIDERAMFAHITKDKRVQRQFIWLFQIEARHAIVNKDYLLLPPTSIWYPQSTVPLTRDILKPFAQFSLDVKTNPALTAIAQGESSQLSPGVFHFESDKPLKELSLIAGPYQRQTVVMDSLNLNFYSMASHNYYKAFFNEIGDTLPALIQEVIQDFEVKVEQDYPFKRLAIVEVPIHFYSYQQNGRENVDFLQPEQIWIPENAATQTTSYFKMQTERQDRFGNHSNQTYTDLEKEIMLFKRFVNSTFAGGSEWGIGEGLFSFIPDLNMYPLFMNFSLALSYNLNEGMAIALEANHKEMAVSKASRRRWAVGELTDEEKANLALSDTSLQYIIQHADESLVNKVLVAKGSYLLKKIKNDLGKENFDTFMQTTIRNNLFKTVPVQEISDELYKLHGFDLDKELKEWFTDDRLPGFQFGAFEKYQIRDGNQFRYQVLFHVNNPTVKAGLIEVEFSYPGEGRFRMTQDNSNTENWLFNIPAGKAQQIALVLDSEPRSVKINTLVSQNLPAVYTYMFDDSELKENRKAIEGQKEISWLKLLQQNKDLVIDNTTENFAYMHPQYRSQLKAWLYKDAQKEKEDYDFFRWWHGPAQWQKLKFPSFYGEFVHSAYYARSGSGERKATWTGPIPDDGLYEVYVYVPDPSDFPSGRHRDRDYLGIQKYTIYHADGTDEVEIDFSKAKPGWNYLETYFFKEGQAKMELTDESEGGMVFADAVKWELRD